MPSLKDLETHRMKNFIIRPTHIEQALVRTHKGQWFTWTDPSNKTYANLRLTEVMGIDGELVPNPTTELPTEEEVNATLLQLQTEWDAENDSYKSRRKAEYPTIEELVVALYDTDDKAAVDEKRAAVKLKYPKT